MAIISERKVNESPKYVGLDETPVYMFVFTDWGTPSNPVVKLLDVTNGYNDISATGLSGSPSVFTTTVVCPAVVGSALQLGHEYELLVQATVASVLMSMYCMLIPER